MENKSIFYICILIIIGFIMLSISLLLANKDNSNKYQMISSNVIIFDSKTGYYCRKFIKPYEGPTNRIKDSVNSKNKIYLNYNCYKM